jgi:preprotein translocase subunit SecE
VNAFFHELISFTIYKRTQGRITRQVTFAAIAIGMAVGLYQLSTAMMQWEPLYQYGIPGGLLAIGVWMTYRLVNVPTFADFLIAVEAEMNKVSWPSRSELIKASIVVLVTIFLLAFILAMYDLLWNWFFRFIGILGKK